MKLPIADIILMLSGLATATQLDDTKQDQAINICDDVNTRDGCITSAALGQSIYFTCENNTQTLFTCDGGCRQNNAANLPTCDFGILYNGTID